MTANLPTPAEAKALARRLRRELEAEGRDISHSRSLELVAAQHGYRDWNTFHAALGNCPPEGYSPGGRVSGLYLSQPFTATVLAVELLRPGWFRVVLDLDDPVDVVTFDSFSNFRKRITGSIGPSGMSRERTSDGVPHLQLHL